MTHLLWQDICPKIFQRQLEFPRLAAEEDLDNDGRIQRNGDVGGSHGGQVRRLTIADCRRG